jgi:hypothetical protein
VDAYFTNPRGKQPPPPPPNPEIIKIQAEQQANAASIQAEQQKTVFETQAEQLMERMKLQMEDSIARLDAQTKLQIAQMEIAAKERIEGKKISADAQVEIFRQQAQGTIKAAEIEHDEKKTDKQLAAKANEKEPKDGRRTADFEQQRSKTDKLEKVLGDTTTALSALKGEVGKLSQAKPRKRTGNFNGKPFEITEA